MKSGFWGVGVLALMSLACLRCDSASDNRIQVYAEPSTIDFGSLPVDPDAKYKASIRIVNAGKKPIHITKIQQTCACMETQVDRKEIGPGDSALIETLVPSPADPALPIKQRLQVSIDGGKASVEIPIIGHIDAGVIIPATRIDFGAVFSGTEQEKRLELKERNDQVAEVSSSSPCIHASMTTGPDRALVIGLVGGEAGYLEERVTVTTAKQVVHRVAVVAEIVPPLYSRPKSVVFTRAPGQSRHLLLESRDRSPLIEVVTPPNVSVEAKDNPLAFLQLDATLDSLPAATEGKTQEIVLRFADKSRCTIPVLYF